MAKTVLQLINNVLALVGEQPLTSSSGNVGLLVRNALETALVNVAQESRANIFETQISATVTADDYLVPAATLATNILQVYTVSVRSSYGSVYGDNLSKLEYLPLDSVQHEPAYSIVGQNLYVSPTVARPLTLHIIALAAPTLPASDSADCGLPEALIGFVSHSAASIIALSYLDDPNQASVHANLAQQLGDKLKAQYGNTRAKSFNLSGQRSSHRFASVSPLPAVYASANKVNSGDVVYVDDVDIDSAFTSALVPTLENTDLLFNRKTSTLYKYNGSEWAEYIPDSEFVFVHKRTNNVFKYANSSWSVLNVHENAYDWGARGDNTTDDYEAIAAMLASVSAFTGVELLFPKGNYRITQPLSVTDAYVVLKGDGNNATVLNFVSCNGFEVDSDAVSIRNMQISTNGTTYRGISITGGFNKIEDVTFGGKWDRAIYCQDLLRSSIRSCIFQKVIELTKAGTAIYSDHSVNITVEACVFSGWDKCIYLSNVISGSGYYSEGWMMSDLVTLDNNSGVYVERGTSIHICNSIIDINKDFGVCTTGGNGLKLTNNWLAGADPAVYPSANFVGFYATNSSDHVVSNNQIYSNLANSQGFYLDSSVTNTVVSNNTINVATTNIDLGTENTIIGNQDTDNTTANNAKTKAFGQLEVNTANTWASRVVLNRPAQKWNFENATDNSFAIADLTAIAVKLKVEPTASGRFTFTTDKFKIDTLPTYADNTAATTGGLVANELYKTATGEVRVVV